MLDVYVGVNYYVRVFMKPIHLEIGTGFFFGFFLVDQFYIVFKCIFIFENEKPCVSIVQIH